MLLVLRYLESAKSELSSLQMSEFWARLLIVHNPVQRLNLAPQAGTLFTLWIDAIQLCMWQHNIIRLAHYIKDCCEVLGAQDNAPDDASTSSSSALAAK